MSINCKICLGVNVAVDMLVIVKSYWGSGTELHNL